MKRHAVVMMTVLAGAFLLLSASLCSAADQKIGVVCFSTLVTGYQRMLEEQEANSRKRDDLMKEQNARRDEINRLAAKLQQHTPDSEAYRKTEDEIRTKTAELESGHTVNVPLFIEQGESVKVDTRTGAYVERAKS